MKTNLWKAPATRLNTKITYQYRDSENYKVWNAIIVRGAMSSEAITEFLFEKQFFVPSQVGFEDLQRLPFQEQDHVWHEILEISSTSEEATHNMDTDFLLRLFRQMSEVDWNHVDVFKKKMCWL